MPRVSYDEIDNYGSSGRGSYFQLKDDGETALVHLLGDDMKDFPGYAVHRVPIGDKHVYVNCLRKSGDPIDECPFCAEGKRDPDLSKVIVKLFIPLYNIDADEVQMWERGKAFFRKLSSYLSHTPHASEVVTEIERVGKKNDTNTDYNLYEKRDVDDDGFDMKNVQDELDERLDKLVYDKTADEMEYYLSHGSFDSDGGEVRRRGSSRDDSRREDSRREERRTPSRRRRDDEDDY